MKIVFFHLFIITSVWACWFFSTGISKVLELFANHAVIMLTMLFGSFVAGSTSLGGGAVAFPVFTKILSIPGHTALVFSLAIQSVGMTAAMLIFWFSKSPVSKRVILGSIIPGGIGLTLSLFVLNQFLLGHQAKVIFSIFSLFVAVVLIFDKQINQRKFRTEKKVIQEKPISMILITISSFFGGILSGLIGTGIDFVLFSLMILYGHIGLKKAVATSVCVMAINALIGIVVVQYFTSHFSGIVVDYWLAAVPIVVIGAPLGALACRYFHRNVIFYLLMFLILLDVVSTILILGKPLHLIMFGLIILCSFMWLKSRVLTKSM